MNFTRDPIIETVITPREGCKLVVRSSKGANQEDYYVDALEVVSFGHSFFFRSIERPKSFLVPVSDYEIFESKEPKIVLKNASADRSIKISGGREAVARPNREGASGEGREESAISSSERAPGPERVDRKRERQRRRSRRGRDRHDSFAPQETGDLLPESDEPISSENALESQIEKDAQAEQPKEKAPSFISKLFPPPTTLIKETLSRYKSVDPAAEDLFPMTSNDSAPNEENASLEDTIQPIPPENQHHLNDEIERDE